MKLKDASYGKTFSIDGNGIKEYWEKTNITFEPEAGESPTDILNATKKIIDEWHKQSNPGLYENTRLPTIPSKVIEEKKNKLFGSIGKDIETVTELTVLKSYELIVNNNSELKKVYDKQFKKLSK